MSFAESLSGLSGISSSAPVIPRPVPLKQCLVELDRLFQSLLSIRVSRMLYSSPVDSPWSSSSVPVTSPPVTAVSSPVPAVKSVAESVPVTSPPVTAVKSVAESTQGLCCVSSSTTVPVSSAPVPVTSTPVSAPVPFKSASVPVPSSSVPVMSAPVPVPSLSVPVMSFPVSATSSPFLFCPRLCWSRLCLSLPVFDCRLPRFVICSVFCFVPVVCLFCPFWDFLPVAR